MPDWEEPREIREILRNEDIKRDLRREVRRSLTVAAVFPALALLLGFAVYKLIGALGEDPSAPAVILFWIGLAVSALLAVTGLYTAVTEGVKGIRLGRVLRQNLFRVERDTLIGKQEGRKSPWAYDSLAYLFYPDRPYCLQFSRGTYRMSPLARQFPYYKLFRSSAARFWTHGKPGDGYWLVWVGETILRAYPADMFDYRDGSPG